MQRKVCNINGANHLLQHENTFDFREKKARVKRKNS